MFLFIIIKINLSENVKQSYLLHFQVVFVSGNFSHLAVSFPIMQGNSCEIVKSLIQVVSHHTLINIDD